MHPQFKITGGVNPVIAGRRYEWEHRDWKAAVTKHNIRDEDTPFKIGDGSQCCHICREKYPETKAWMKFNNYSICECMTFNNSFDPSKYVTVHGAYSIGSCE